MSDHWEVLGIAPVDDVRAVKRAYAALLKRHKPESDPHSYQRLRAAFDAAIGELRSATRERGRFAGRDAARQAPTPAGHDPPSSARLDAVNDALDAERVNTETAEQAERTRGGPEYRLSSPLPETVPTELQDQPPESRPDETEQHDDERQRAANGRQRWRNDGEARDEPPSAIAKGRAIAQALLEFAAAHPEAAAVQRLESLLVDEADLVNLHARRAFELHMAAGLAHWRHGRFPIALCENLQQVFAWQRIALAGDPSAHLFAQAQKRLLAAQTFAALRALGDSRPWWRRSDEQQVAAALSGALKPRHFRWLRFKTDTTTAMRTRLDGLQEQCPEIFAHEIDPEVAQWWFDALDKPQVNSDHALIVALFALFGAIAATTVVGDYQQLWFAAIAPLSSTALMGVFAVTFVFTVAAMLPSLLLIERGLKHFTHNVLTPLKWSFIRFRESRRVHVVALVALSMIILGAPAATPESEIALLFVGGALFAFVDALHALASAMLALFGLMVMSLIYAGLDALFEVHSKPHTSLMLLALVWAHVGGLHLARRVICHRPLGSNTSQILFFVSYLLTMAAAAVIAGGANTLWSRVLWSPIQG